VFFLIGSLFGGVLGIAFYAVAGINPDPVALLILAIILGVLALAYQKFMITLSTAFAGAGGVVGGVAYLTDCTLKGWPRQSNIAKDRYLFQRFFRGIDRNYHDFHSCLWQMCCLYARLLINPQKRAYL